MEPYHRVASIILRQCCTITVITSYSIHYTKLYESIPAYGYGIRYDHGIFRQVMQDGWQHELPEEWLSSGNPWEFERPEVAYSVGFGGTVEARDNA